MGSLSEFQQQLILGCVLGDGYMRKKTHAHLQITHSFKQKEYVDWKYQILKNLVITPPKTYKGNALASSAYKGNGDRVGYRFFTRSLPELTSIYMKFYSDKVKKVPKDIILKPITLAVWYMDDGSKSYKSCYFNTQEFDSESQNNLIKALLKSKIEARLNKDKQYFRIRVLTSSAPHLMDIIKPYVVKSMRYKIPV